MIPRLLQTYRIFFDVPTFTRKQAMAPSTKNVPAVLLLLLVLLITMAAIGGGGMYTRSHAWVTCFNPQCHCVISLSIKCCLIVWLTRLERHFNLLHKCWWLDRIHAESASVDGYPCGHLSSNYKGLCLEWIHDNDCKRVCIDESSNNVGGHCDVFECWCDSICTTETVDAASAPTRQW